MIPLGELISVIDPKKEPSALNQEFKKLQRTRFCGTII